jgi:hypothetical protein
MTLSFTINSTRNGGITMPRRNDNHREINIEISEEAVEEALAMWITEHHGFEVDRKQIEIVKDEDGKTHAKIKKRAKKPVEVD